MSAKLIGAICAITLALVFYTIGVFGERKAHTLRKKDLILFYAGLVCDTTGTSIMASIAQTNPAVADADLTLHAITGGAAILFMLFHAAWATFVYFKGTNQAKEKFHKFSGIVWCFWLIPYICGVFIGSPMPIKGIAAFMISVVIAALVYILTIRPKQKA